MELESSKEIGVHCCIPSCKTTRTTTRTLSFYEFPQDKKLRNEWIAALRDYDMYHEIMKREGVQTVSSLTICSKHFCSDDFEKLPTRDNKSISFISSSHFKSLQPDVKTKSESGIFGRSLTSDAVPSIFAVANKCSIEKSKGIKVTRQDKLTQKRIVPGANKKPHNHRGKPKNAETSTSLISHTLHTVAAKVITKDTQTFTPTLSTRKKVPFKDVISHMKLAVTASLLNTSGNGADAEQKRYAPRASTSTSMTQAGKANKNVTKPSKKTKAAASFISKGRAEVTHTKHRKITISEVLTKPVTLGRQEEKFVPSALPKEFKTNVPDPSTESCRPPQVVSRYRPRKQNIMNADPERKQAGFVQHMLSNAISKVFANTPVRGDSSRRKGSLGQLFHNRERKRHMPEKLASTGKLQKAGRYTVMINPYDMGERERDDASWRIDNNDESDERLLHDEECDDEETIVDHDSYSNHLRLPDHQVLRLNMDDSDNDDGEHDGIDPLDLQNTACVSNVKLDESTDNDTIEEYAIPLLNGFGFQNENTDSIANACGIGSELMSEETEKICETSEDVKPLVSLSLIEKCESSSEILPQVSEDENNAQDLFGQTGERTSDSNCEGPWDPPPIKTELEETT